MYANGKPMFLSMFLSTIVVCKMPHHARPSVLARHGITQTNRLDISSHVNTLKY